MKAEIIPLKQKFSKGLAAVRGDNNVPVQYASFLRNIRFGDKGISPRNGYSSVYKGDAGEEIKGLIAYERDERLLRVYDGNLEEVDYGNNSVATIDEITDAYYRYLVYGKYIMLFNGIEKPWVLDTTDDTLTHLTTDIDDNCFPSFGEKFNNYTFVANGSTLYSSLAIVAGSESNCYKWVSTGDTARQMPFPSNILALKSTLEKMWIFTEDSIEFISGDTITTVGEVVTITPQHYASGEKILNPDVVVAAGSKLFWITKGMKIRAIGYYEGVAQLQIGDVSDIPLVGIDDFMQNELHSDQSKAFGYFDADRNIIKWHMRPKDSYRNYICIVYDLVNSTFGIDDNKIFSHVVSLGSKLYASTATKNNQIFEEEVGKADNERGIICKYNSTNIKLGQATLKKFFRGGEHAGKVNDLTKITLQVIVDGKIVMKPMIVYQGEGVITNDGIGANTIGGVPIGEDVKSYRQFRDYRKVITQSQVRAKGIYTRWERTFEGLGQDRILDEMSLFVFPPTGKFKLTDKF